MFWLAIVLIIIAVLWFVFAPTRTIVVQKATYDQEKKTEKVSLKPIGWVPMGLAIALILLSCLTVVGTRNVGVEKFFGATTGRTMGPGLHLKAPWNGVEDIDGTIQPEEYTTSHPIHVKIGDLGEADVALAYRWRINPGHADDAFKDYRNAEDGILTAIRKALVSTNIKSSLNEEIGSYNPLADVVITADMTPEQISKVKIPPIPYAALNAAVKANLEEKVKKLGGLVSIESVNIEHLKLPSGTQNKINAMNTKIQDSRNTLIDISIKAAQAKANEKLSTSVDKSPNVLVSKCFDGLIDGDITNEPGFSCWGPSGSVVIPAK